MGKRFIYLFKILLLCFFDVLSIILLYDLYRLNLFSSVRYAIVFVFVVLIMLLFSFLLFKRKRNQLIYVAFSILFVIFSFVYGFSIYSLENTRNYIKDAASVRKLEYRTYQIVVLKKSKINELSELGNKNIGFVTEDLMSNNVDTLSKDISFTHKSYEDATKLLDGLLKEEVSAISIDKGYLSSMKYENEALKKKIKTIYTYSVYFENKDNKIDNHSDTDIMKPFVLYISGSDSRTNARSRARSDTNIIAVVRPNDHKILLVSIPRDYYVYLHGVSSIRDKLTHAGIYGIDMSIQTVQDILDISIDRYIKVSFASVIRAVDVLDGLDIYSDIDFIPFTNRNCSFHQGVQHVDGTCALAFSRERKSYLTGDKHRGENQEQVISLMVEKLSQMKYLMRYNDLLDATRGSFDTNFTYDEMTSLIQYELKDLAKWDIEIYNLDGEGAMLPTYSMGSMNLWVMIPDETTIELAKIKINEYLK